MSLKKRIEALEQEENGREEFAEWQITVEIGKEKRTFARNTATGQETEDPGFIQRVDTWQHEQAKRLGVVEHIVVVAGEYTWKNGVLVTEAIPEPSSGIVKGEFIVKGSAI